MKLVSVTPADDGVHKYEAKFENGNGVAKTKTTKFGAKGMDDYTKTKDKEQRARYLERHSRNENWSDPTSAGSLSKHLLWGESTSMMANLRAFRNKFNL
jgi:hypothetical protein